MTAVAAVVVSYNPVVDELAAFIDELDKQFSTVIVVDNSDDPDIKATLLQRFSDGPCVLVPLSSNQGVGMAQNRGIETAFSAGADFVVTFDQDSRIGEGYVRTLLDAFVHASLEHTVAAVGPRPVDAATGENYVNVSEGATRKVSTLMSSGMLISKMAYEMVGPMDTSLFIDLVDWEWCFRARKKGFVVMLEPSVVLFHRLGESHTSTVIGAIGEPLPFRHYYAFRNYLLLVRMGYVPLLWKLKYLVINLGKLTLYPLFMSEGLLRLRYMLAGIRDGLQGRRGPLL